MILNGSEFDKTFAQVTTTEEVIHHLTVSCIITTITPVNEYIIQKTDSIYSLRPELTSKELLVLVNELLAPKQVEQVAEMKSSSNTQQLTDYLHSKFGNKYKTLIRQAWSTGNYSKLGVTADQKALLQSLRNQGYKL